MTVDTAEFDDSILPPIERQDLLIHLYFAFVHPEHPVLDKTSFLIAFENKLGRFMFHLSPLMRCLIARIAVNPPGILFLEFPCSILIR